MENTQQNQQTTNEDFSQNDSTYNQNISGNQKVDELLLPINRSAWAIAAGYVALLNLVFFLAFITAPITIILAIVAVVDLKKNPTKKGMGRVWFAFVMSGISLGLLILLIVLHNFS